jgi:hypothetical protein
VDHEKNIPAMGKGFSLLRNVNFHENLKKDDLFLQCRYIMDVHTYRDFIAEKSYENATEKCAH